MFEKLKQLFTANSEESVATLDLPMVAGALLLEISKADYNQDAVELIKVQRLLELHYRVAVPELESFMGRAAELGKDSTSLYPFTRYINDNCSMEEKYQLVHSLWDVAMADGEISKYEEHLIRKIAELIYLPHREFIRAKLDVLGEE